MTRKELETYLEGKGYTRNRWGHYTKTVYGVDGLPKVDCMFKLKDMSFSRYIKRIGVDSDWFKLNGKTLYYSQHCVKASGKLGLIG